MKVSEILQEIENNGFVKLSNFLDENQFNRLKAFVDEKIQAIKNNFFFVDKSEDSIFIKDEEIYKKFHKLFTDLVGIKNLNQNEKIYKVLRYIRGKQSEEESFKFHFDAHNYTILIPIYIPKRIDSDNGDLIMIPNLRKLHKNLIKNILQKLFFQSKLYKAYIKHNMELKTKKLILEEGNIYIFNGYRSLHGNLNIHQNDQRATILLHYHDVIQDSKIIKLNRLLRQKKESKKIKL